MSDVTEHEPRERIAIRLSASGLAHVRQLADQETEGNVSLMIRRLLNEALAARTTQAATKR